MRRPWAALPDRYMALAFASLGTIVPISVEAIMYATGAERTDHWLWFWLFSVLPGVGMSISGTLGNSMVVAGALSVPMSSWRRNSLLATAAVVFASTIFVLSSFLRAGTHNDGGELSDVLGPNMLWLWNVALFVMAEGPAPCLIVLSALIKSAQVKVQRTVQEAGAGTPQRILIELLDAGDAGKTAASLADALDVGVATVGKYLKKDLEKKGYVHSVMVPGSAAAVWKIGAAP